MKCIQPHSEFPFDSLTGRSLCCLEANMLNCNIIVSVFEFQLFFYIPFHFGKSINLLISLIQVWIKWYHYCSSTMIDLALTYKGWYTIKQRNQTNHFPQWMQLGYPHQYHIYECYLFPKIFLKIWRFKKGLFDSLDQNFQIFLPWQYTFKKRIYYDTFFILLPKSNI